MTAVADPTSAMARAARAAVLFAVDPLQSGVVLRAPAGPARDAWLALLRDLLPRETPMRRAPIGVGDDRLIGGLDLAATLRAGRPVAETGLMAQAHGGVLQIAMAERLSPGGAARLAAALDHGGVSVERDGLAMRHPARFGVVALDEGCCDDECPPDALRDRLPFMLDLAALSHRDICASGVTRAEIAEARRLLPSIVASRDVVATIVSIAARLGVASLRAPMHAARIARAVCALRGDFEISEDDIAEAACLALAPRATTLPDFSEEQAPADEDGPQPSEPESNEPEAPTDAGSDDAGVDDSRDAPHAAMDEMVLAAVAAAIPPGLLARINAGALSRAKGERQGKAGDVAASTRRGRPIGVRSGQLREGRLGLVETLRVAAPWQGFRRGLRQDAEPRRVLVQAEDFRIRRYRERRETTAIFVVDASGSAAMQRLAEVKGAIELLLADCYVRRDNVALVAFRGAGAEIALPPTRSLARAKRELAGLPGGGGTPLAAGLDAAVTLADALKRKGQSPLLVLMTDGRANVCRDGSGGRVKAMEEALTAGRRARVDGVPALAIDTSPAFGAAVEPPTLKIAQAMNARYLKLPSFNAAELSEAVRATAPAH